MNDGGSPAIAPTAYGREHRSCRINRGQRSSQQRDRFVQGSFTDVDAVPGPREELVLGDDISGFFEQTRQQPKRARRALDDRIVDSQFRSVYFEHEPQARHPEFVLGNRELWNEGLCFNDGSPVGRGCRGEMPFDRDSGSHASAAARMNQFTDAPEREDSSRVAGRAGRVERC